MNKPQRKRDEELDVMANLMSVWNGWKRLIAKLKAIHRIDFNRPDEKHLKRSANRSEIVVSFYVSLPQCVCSPIISILCAHFSCFDYIYHVLLLGSF